ncbi:MAG: aromatic-ring-hydroxylating dioxygenase subunit beta [Acidimicrobiia bacterium]
MDDRVVVEAGPDPALHFQVEQFLYREAALLDDGLHDAWLALFAEDVNYQMPVRTTRARASGSGFDEEMGFFSEDHASLTMRVKRLDTEFAWAEDPPSRTRRLVTNVLVEPGPDGELEVRSNVLVYRTRTDNAIPELFSCSRHDLLRPTGNGFAIARRTVYVDQTVLGGLNLSIFF